MRQVFFIQPQFGQLFTGLQQTIYQNYGVYSEAATRVVL